MVSCPMEAGFMHLHDLMRMLWEQHAAWTRMTIISIAEDLPDLEQTTARLLRNPADLAAVFRPLYGDEVADHLKDLVTAHLVLAADLVKAAKAGDTARAAEIERQWYANGQEIADFLSSINPYWSREELRRMWRIHLDQVKAQAVARLNKDYAADIAAYDQGEQHLLMLADILTEGLIRQFPYCFTMM